MFEVPDAKRVRRADLDVSEESGNGSDDDGYDAELQARLNAHIARSLGITESYSEPQADEAKSSQPTEEQAGTREINLEAPKTEGDAFGETEEAADEEFAFRLFSTAKPTQKVVLEEDKGPTGDGSLATKRPLSFYVAGKLTDAQKQQYAAAAVTGKYVLASSKDRSWGLEMPWKVTNISITRRLKPGESTASILEDKATTKKRRPGKKQRISLRTRARAKEEKKQVEAQKILEKEEHIKEKKKRMNRLKKLRKRAKNKEAKSAANGGEGGVDEDEEDESE